MEKPLNLKIFYKTCGDFIYLLLVRKQNFTKEAIMVDVKASIMDMLIQRLLKIVFPPVCLNS